MSFFLTHIYDQKCYLSYTGKNGMVHSTSKGRGWNDKGIERYNYFIRKVFIDRENRSNSFDLRFFNYCTEIYQPTRSTKKRKLTKTPNDTDESPQKNHSPICLTMDMLKKTSKRWKRTIEYDSDSTSDIEIEKDKDKINSISSQHNNNDIKHSSESENTKESGDEDRDSESNNSELSDNEDDDDNSDKDNISDNNDVEEKNKE